MGFFSQEYWSGLPFPSPGDLPDSGIEPRAPALQADSLPSQGSPGAVPVVKNVPARAGETRYTGSIPGSGRPPGGGHGYPLQYSCLENPMDRGAWRLQSTESQGVGRD